MKKLALDEEQVLGLLHFYSSSYVHAYNNRNSRRENHDSSEMFWHGILFETALCSGQLAEELGIAENVSVGQYKAGVKRKEIE